MAQPVAYTPVTSFITYQNTQPWFPGQNIDVELNNLKATTDQIRNNLALIMRDDGTLLGVPGNLYSLNIALTGPNEGSQGAAPIHYNSIVVNDGSHITSGAGSTALVVERP